MGSREAPAVLPWALRMRLGSRGANSELTYLYIFLCVNTRIAKHAVWSTQSASSVPLALSLNYSSRVAITWAVCGAHSSSTEMLPCLPTIVRGHDIDSFVVWALDHMASVLTDGQQPATIPCPWYTAVWHLKTQLLLEPPFSGHPQPRSQGSLLPVPTGRRENLGTKLRSPSG